MKQNTRKLPNPIVYPMWILDSFIHPCLNEDNKLHFHTRDEILFISLIFVRVHILKPQIQGRSNFLRVRLQKFYVRIIFKNENKLIIETN